MSMLQSDRYVSVVVDGTRVKVGGRVYETTHVLIIGAHSATIELTSLTFRMETYMPIDSRVDSTIEDVLKIYMPESRFEVDSHGSRMNIKQNEVTELWGDMVTIKLEADMESGSVLVKIPRFKRIKAQKVRISVDTEVSANFILSPLVGVLSITRAKCVLKESDTELEIRCSGVEEGLDVERETRAHLVERVEF